MSLNGIDIAWVNTIKYLGTCILFAVRSLDLTLLMLNVVSMPLAVLLINMPIHLMNFYSFPYMLAIVYFSIHTILMVD
jgi:hypothetical protein